MSELPGLYELEAFVDEISPDVRSKLAWQINKSLGLDTNAIRQLLKDKSIVEEWLRFEQESK
jgi:2-hydroxychromene-2-carboxylate isomerase